MSEAVLELARPRVSLRAILVSVGVVCAVAALAYWMLALRGWESTDDAFIEGHMVLLSPRVPG